MYVLNVIIHSAVLLAFYFMFVRKKLNKPMKHDVKHYTAACTNVVYNYIYSFQITLNGKSGNTKLQIQKVTSAKRCMKDGVIYRHFTIISWQKCKFF